MAWVVLLKGANTGGKTFRPSVLPKELPALGLVSIGAAGTFVARTSATAESIRKTVRAKLPFDPTITIVPGADILRLLREDPIGGEVRAPGVRKFITIASEPLSPEILLPIDAPTPEAWAVRVLAVDGPFAMGLCRRMGPRVVYPTDVIERAYSVEATTRWWESLESVGKELRSSPNPPGR
ncbi:MAG: hypothetical protein WAK40_01370 [Thermoplasmata archaeon]